MIKKLKWLVRKIKRDKRYRAGFLIVMFLLTFFIGRMVQAGVDKEKFNIQRMEIVDQYEAQILEMQEQYAEDLVHLKNEYETPTIDDIYKSEAEYIAKVLYGTAPNHSKRDQRTVVWCILNRVDHYGYPDTVEGVCKQASQWIGYSDDNPIITELYELALEELMTWHSNYRPVNEKYIYMSWSSKEISLRDTFEVKKSTQYWRAAEQ